MPDRTHDQRRLLDVRWEDTDAAPGPGTPQLTVLLSIAPVAGGELRAVAVVTGEIDISTAEPLRTAVRELAQAADPGPGSEWCVVLDLAGVTFLDSSALHLLDRLHLEGIAKGWTLRVIAPTARAANRVLRLAESRGW
jgi:anti-anti-sigma factor